jgi:hypothetical protein
VRQSLGFEGFPGRFVRHDHSLVVRIPWAAVFIPDRARYPCLGDELYLCVWNRGDHRSRPRRIIGDRRR